MDLSGQRFNNLIVIERTDRKYGTSWLWECKCDCGNTTYVISAKLKNGHTKSCGCLATKDLANNEFGRLVVIDKAYSKNGKQYWNCQCECGNTTQVPTDRLLSGKTKSCGCFRTELSEARINQWNIDDHSGKNHPNWQGGITDKLAKIRNSNEYSEWRDMVFERDNYTCLACKSRGVLIHAHHLVPFRQYEELRLEISNGVTLCQDCHRLFHSIYGVKYFDDIDFLEFIYNYG